MPAAMMQSPGLDSFRVRVKRNNPYLTLYIPLKGPRVSIFFSIITVLPQCNFKVLGFGGLRVYIRSRVFHFRASSGVKQLMGIDSEE